MTKIEPREQVADQVLVNGDRDAWRQVLGFPSMEPKRQWADQYGSKWYLHKDGTPPRDDDHDYFWHRDLQQWVRADMYENFEL